MAGATWEPQADRVLGLYLAPFSGISHREQKQPSTVSSKLGVGIQNKSALRGLDCREGTRGPVSWLRHFGRVGAAGWSWTPLRPLAVSVSAEAWVEGRGGVLVMGE